MVCKCPRETSMLLDVVKLLFLSQEEHVWINRKLRRSLEITLCFSRALLYPITGCTPVIIQSTSRRHTGGNALPTSFPLRAGENQSTELWPALCIHPHPCRGGSALCFPAHFFNVNEKQINFFIGGCYEISERWGQLSLFRLKIAQSHLLRHLLNSKAILE